LWHALRIAFVIARNYLEREQGRGRKKRRSFWGVIHQNKWKGPKSGYFCYALPHSILVAIYNIYAQFENDVLAKNAAYFDELQPSGIVVAFTLIRARTRF
jgi:hypothetical protein